MITKAEYIKDYKLEVYFDNNIKKEINLYSFINNSKLPMVRKYLDVKKFRAFHLQYGALTWGSNEMDINPLSILNGDFD